ncbi:hypothetical protein [Tsukamurella sp. USMM236]|uniref:hypothetical protein n=1 Tax=Tsukamurella sp. USMM236 TaxID=3081301 RepID=UPI00301AFDC0
MTPGWATIIVGTAAVVMAIVTIGQKRLADNRKEWWTRCQWALEATYAGDRMQQRDGWAVIEGLLKSTLATSTERDIAMHLALTRYRRDTGSENTGEGGSR